MKVYAVGLDPLDEVPSASADPEACFVSRDAAVAWGEQRAVLLIGSRHWWGEVLRSDQTYTIWELDLVDA